MGEPKYEREDETIKSSDPEFKETHNFKSKVPRNCLKQPKAIEPVEEDEDQVKGDRRGIPQGYQKKSP